MEDLLFFFAQYHVNLAPLPHVSGGPSVVQSIFRIIFPIIGALSVLMFVIGGFRYITAQGDPQQISKAKGTLIYAIVGLVISITAVGIVTFVLGKAV